MSAYWILVRQGLVQRFMGEMNGKAALLWPVAETHEDAMKLADWFNAESNPPSPIRPSQIGTVKGETIEGHLKMALDEGCVAVCCVAGWNPDGTAQWKYIPFD